MHERERVCCAVLAGVVLSGIAGCFSPQLVAHRAVAYNRAVERTTNEVVLLNVLRAAERRPMHVTAFASLTGSVARNLKGALTTPFGPDAMKAFPLLSEGAFNSNPSFSLAVLDNQEFTLGFTTPVAPETIAYLLDQGWRPAILMHLLVREVRFVADPAERPRSLMNYIPDPRSRPQGPQDGPAAESYRKELAGFERYQEFVDRWVACEPWVQFESAYGPVLTQRPEPKDEVAAFKEGLVLADLGGGTWQYHKPKAGVRIRFAKGCSYATEEDDVVLCGEGTGAACPAGDGASASTARIGTSADVARLAVPAPQRTGEPEVVFVLNSPESVLYHLGELARLSLHGDGPLRILDHGARRPLFVVKRRSDCSGPAAVEVEQDGETYVVPGGDLWSTGDCAPGRSMVAINLVERLINLQKKGAALPTTGLFTVVGGGL